MEEYNFLIKIVILLTVIILLGIFITYLVSGIYNIYGQFYNFSLALDNNPLNML